MSVQEVALYHSTRASVGTGVFDGSFGTIKELKTLHDTLNSYIRQL